MAIYDTIGRVEEPCNAHRKMVAPNESVSPKPRDHECHPLSIRLIVAVQSKIQLLQSTLLVFRQLRCVLESTRVDTSNTQVCSLE